MGVGAVGQLSAAEGQIPPDDPILRIGFSRFLVKPTGVDLDCKALSDCGVQNPVNLLRVILIAVWKLRLRRGADHSGQIAAQIVDVSDGVREVELLEVSQDGLIIGGHQRLDGSKRLPDARGFRPADRIHIGGFPTGTDRNLVGGADDKLPRVVAHKRLCLAGQSGIVREQTKLHADVNLEPPRKGGFYLLQRLKIGVRIETEQAGLVKAQIQMVGKADVRQSSGNRRLAHRLRRRLGVRGKQRMDVIILFDRSVLHGRTPVFL